MKYNSCVNLDNYSVSIGTIKKLQIKSCKTNGVLGTINRVLF